MTISLPGYSCSRMYATDSGFGGVAVAVAVGDAVGVREGVAVAVGIGAGVRVGRGVAVG